jgi:hypothetical protein
MQGGEYFKLNNLVGHYLTHQSSEVSYSDFLSFLNDHYLKKDHHEKEHKELPFKSNTAQTVVIAYTYNVVESISVMSAIEAFETTHYFYKKSIPTQEQGSVWNPPRMV